MALDHTTKPAGNTALYDAAHLGSLRGAKAVYRLFHMHSWLSVNNNKMSYPKSSYVSGEQVPVEDWGWVAMIHVPKPLHLTLSVPRIRLGVMQLERHIWLVIRMWHYGWMVLLQGWIVVA